MDRNDITRISDLPDNSGFRQGGQNNNRRQDFGQSPTQYTPLNVHQNQFGIPPPTDTQLPTISVRGDNQMNYGGGPMDQGTFGPLGSGSLGSGTGSLGSGTGSLGSGSGSLGGTSGFSGEPQYPSLPSMPNRGIPQDTTAFQNDEYMIPNHVPNTKLTNDYLRDYETRLEKMSEEHQKQKHREDLVVSTYDEFQTPILIGVMFFLFQLPIINMLIFKYLGFLKIHNEDGNMNLYGIMLKSMMFGLFYFGFIKATTFI